MTVEIIFEYHSTSTDNETGVASGWNDPPLSAGGRALATELGQRRQVEQIDAVFCSDLRRAIETAEIALGGRAPIYADRRLREYDYGTMTGAPVDQIHVERPARVQTPFPGGESLRDVANGVRDFLDDLIRAWNGKRVTIIGHGATKLALDHLLGGMTLDEAAGQPFTRQPVPPSYRYALES